MKCNEDDTIGDLKKLIAAQVGTRPEKIRIQKWYTIYKVPSVPHIKQTRLCYLTRPRLELRYIGSFLFSHYKMLDVLYSPLYFGEVVIYYDNMYKTSYHFVRRNIYFSIRPPCSRLAVQDHITLEDYEIHDGMGLEMYYN